MIENPMSESGITADELAEWNNLFQTAPLNGISYVTSAGGVLDLSGPYPIEKAKALAAFLNAARTSWPRTVLELEAVRRERDDFRIAYEAEARARKEQIGLMKRRAETAERERDELRAQLNESNYHASRAMSERAGFALEVDSLRTRLEAVRRERDKLHADNESIRAMLRDNPSLSDMDALQFEINFLRGELSKQSIPESVQSHDPARLAPVPPRLSSAWDHGDHYGGDDEDENDD